MKEKESGRTDNYSRLPNARSLAPERVIGFPPPVIIYVGITLKWRKSLFRQVVGIIRVDLWSRRPT